MTPTATYIAEENCLQPLPRMEEPAIQDYAWQHEYDEAYKKYNAHLATLRKIPCSPEPGFKDGEKYTEGVDYEIKGAGDWKWCYQLKGNVFAAPIVPVSEDELWDELFLAIHIQAQSHSGLMGQNHPGLPNDKPWHEATIAELKQKYSLTKR